MEAFVIQQTLLACYQECLVLVGKDAALPAACTTLQCCP
jgi:hypothetical protein